MPKKYIDDVSSAQLDELYVRCVTLTQNPVKEVEVLRLAIMKGVPKISDDDILKTLSVNKCVWQRLAEQTWTELMACLPKDDITMERFDVLAGEYSDTWQKFTAPACRTAIRELLKPRLQEPFVHGSSDKDGFRMSEGNNCDVVESDEDLDYICNQKLMALQGSLYSELSTQEKDLIHSYRDRARFVPDGKGDYLVEVHIMELSE